jgi:hypothetical protein
MGTIQYFHLSNVYAHVMTISPKMSIFKKKKVKQDNSGFLFFLKNGIKTTLLLKEKNY